MSILPTALARSCAVAPALLLAACIHRPLPAPMPAPVPTYFAPDASVPTARLSMRNEIQPADWYQIDVFADPAACAGPQRVGTGNRTIDARATALAAGRWQTIEVRINEPHGYVCPMRLSFAPSAGRSYVLTAASNPDGTCTLQLRDETDPQAIRPEPTLRRRNVDKQACVPLAQTKPLGFSAERVPREEATDLPIAPVDHVPSATHPAAADQPIPAVSADDLKGLTGR